MYGYGKVTMYFAPFLNPRWSMLQFSLDVRGRSILLKGLRIFPVLLNLGLALEQFSDLLTFLVGHSQQGT